MPTYEYQCEDCLTFTDVYKPMSESGSLELCSQCQKPMQRIIGLVQMNLSTAKVFEPHFNPAFGKKMYSPHDIKEEIRRIKGETGKEIVEVGNDSLQSIKKKRQAYTLD